MRMESPKRCDSCKLDRILGLDIVSKKNAYQRNSE